MDLILIQMNGKNKTNDLFINFYILDNIYNPYLGTT